jgi:hypothetical protein
LAAPPEAATEAVTGERGVVVDDQASAARPIIRRSAASQDVPEDEDEGLTDVFDDVPAELAPEPAVVEQEAAPAAPSRRQAAAGKSTARAKKSEAGAVGPEEDGGSAPE